ncbi:MAG TPA: hypothetical protein VGK99_13675, partial [Acidobacteriota bacterium]
RIISRFPIHLYIFFASAALGMHLSWLYFKKDVFLGLSNLFLIFWIGSSVILAFALIVIPIVLARQYFFPLLFATLSATTDLLIDIYGGQTAGRKLSWGEKWWKEFQIYLK